MTERDWDLEAWKRNLLDAVVEDQRFRLSACAVGVWESALHLDAIGRGKLQTDFLDLELKQLDYAIQASKVCFAGPDDVQRAKIDSLDQGLARLRTLVESAAADPKNPRVKGEISSVAVALDDALDSLIETAWTETIKRIEVRRG